MDVVLILALIKKKYHVPLASMPMGGGGEGEGGSDSRLWNHIQRGIVISHIIHSRELTVLSLGL
jgi:hypothetical protein